MNATCFRSIVFFAAAFFAPYGLLSASGGATLTGTVTDPSGAAVNRASVSLHQIAGSALLVTATDSSGHFSFAGVAPGEYLLEASTSALNLPHPQTVTLTADQTVDEVLQLEVTAIKSEVSVTAAGEPQTADQVSKSLDIVNVADAEKRGLFSVPDAIQFLPGIRVSEHGGPGSYTEIQTRGLRYIDTSILIDGFRFRDPTAPQGDASAFIGDLFLVDTSRIEVLRGSGSSLYGTNAMAGTVNLMTDSGSGPLHGDLDLQGGGLGLFHGVAKVAGGVLNNRLSYSLGVSNLSVTEGVDNSGATRNWSEQGGLLFAFTPKMRIAADVFANNGYAQVSVGAAPTDTAPAGGIIPAIPITSAQLVLADNNQSFNAGTATFVPSLRDPDSGIYSHYVNSLYRFDHELNSRLSYRLAYGLVNVERNNTDGPGGPGFYQPFFNSSDKFTGRIDTAQATLTYQLGHRQILTAGYEFEQEHYLEAQTDQNPDLTQRANYRTDARQRTNAAFAQDELRFLNNQLVILLSGRFTQANLDQPKFTGAVSPYANTVLPVPPAAYTGDASISYFAKSTSTKVRGHVGNSFRMPSLYERFGGTLFDGVDYAYGDPRLSPERSVSLDFGFDQYAFGQRLRISSSYFYEHLQQIISFLGFPPSYVDPYGRSGGYSNTRGGISRGVEVSGEFRPFGKTSIFASYTYTNARDRTSIYYTGTDVAPLQSTRIMPHMVSIVATQQVGKHADLGLDFLGGSNYLYPLYGYAYVFNGPRQLGLSGGYTLSFTERTSARLYFRVSNALDQSFYEDGFRTPPRWAVAGLHLSF